MTYIKRIPLILDGLTWQQKELERLIETSPMTIYLWRKRQDDPLPCKIIPIVGSERHHVLFVRTEVVPWLRRNRPEKLRAMGLYA
jgi:hypothetical protein